MDANLCFISGQHEQHAQHVHVHAARSATRSARPIAGALLTGLCMAPPPEKAACLCLCCKRHIATCQHICATAYSCFLQAVRAVQLLWRPPHTRRPHTLSAGAAAAHPAPAICPTRRSKWSRYGIRGRLRPELPAGLHTHLWRTTHAHAPASHNDVHRA